MKILELGIDYYVDRLKKGRYFCFPGYSDAEFFCMMGIRLGHSTGLGQILDGEHGKKLLDVMQRRQHDPRWLFAIPKCLWGLPQFSEGRIDTFLQRNNVDIHGYERDMVLDDLAKNAGLYPLISQLKKMDTVVIGPRELTKGSLSFLNCRGYVEIPSPNLHKDTATLEYTSSMRLGKDKVILVSAGVSSPIIIDRMYEICPDNFYIDCGSIWDTFAGIGGQRQWRADLYKDKDAYYKWCMKNIYGDKHDS